MNKESKIKRVNQKGVQQGGRMQAGIDDRHQKWVACQNSYECSRNGHSEAKSWGNKKDICEHIPKGSKEFIWGRGAFPTLNGGE